MNSLRLRLLLWVMAPMLLALGATAWQSWRNASALAQVVQDHQLLTSAQVMADNIDWRDGQLSALTPPAALEIFASNAQDQVYFQVQTAGGTQLAGWPDLPVHTLAQDDVPIYENAEFRGQSIRLASVTRTLYKNNQPIQVHVSVAETRGAYHTLVHSLWWPTLLRESALLALALLLMLLGLTLELRPLLRLRKDVLSRDHADLRPLRSLELQNELRPIADAINRYAARLLHQVELQKQFVADAAHQLRTPVALISTQLDYATRQSCSTELQGTLQALHTTTRHLTRTINQLLHLFQAEAFLAQTPELVDLDLQAQLHEVLIELAMLAEAKAIDLGFHTEPDIPMVRAHPALLHAMLFNLIDNAIRYTPAGGNVQVGVQTQEHSVICTIDDTGPGIPADQREQVFKRFQRGNVSDHAGSGLGLAIVREAARTCGASVALMSPAGGTGLRVLLRFAAQPHR